MEENVFHDEHEAAQKARAVQALREKKARAVKAVHAEVAREVAALRKQDAAKEARKLAA